MNLDKRLLQLLKFVRLPLGLSVSSGILGGLSTIIQAWLLARIINRVFLEKAILTDITDFLLFFALVSLVRAALIWISQARGQHVATKIKIELRSTLTKHIASLGPLYIIGEKSGELTNTIHTGVETLNAYFSQYIPQLFYSSIIPVSILIFVFPFDLLSGFVFLLTAPLIPIFMILIGQSAQAITQKQWKTLSRMNAHFLDVLQGLTTLKIFGRSKSEADNIYKISDLFRQTTMKVLKVAFLSALVLEMAATLSIAVIAVEIGLRLMYAKMNFEPALFILILAPEFYQPMRQLGARFHAGMEGVAAAQRIFEILELSDNETLQKGEIEKKREKEYEHEIGKGTDYQITTNIQADLPLDSFKKKQKLKDFELNFKKVTYIYPKSDKAALNDLDFKIPFGKKTALVGVSGSGKSTIVNLILRFAKPTQGEISIGRQNLNSIPNLVWRSQVSWLPQKPYLFHQTIAENILLACPDASEDQMVSACEQANFFNFVESLPQKFETVIGERGARLSAGQAQRLALSRAFIKDAPLLVLDEPTSNLDPHSDMEIQRTIQQLSAGRTVLMIAHRFGSMQMADRIIVLDKGRIVEKGTHNLLMESNGYYSHLINHFAGTEQ